MLEDLAEVVRLDRRERDHAAGYGLYLEPDAPYAALTFLQTHHATITKNDEAVARCNALYKEWIAKAEQSSVDNCRTQATNLWEHAEQLKEALQ